jgi:Predicted pPIWI-associating nuclease
MSAAIGIQSKSANVWFKGLPEKLAEAARNYQLAETQDWQALDELSQSTRFEGMEAYGESAVVENGENIAPGRVHVELVYNEPEGPLTFHDSFPARVVFVVNRMNETVLITRVEADTSSFFED